MNALALLTLLAFDATETPVSQRLTMEQVVEMAVESSSALKAARARARGGEEQAKSLRGRLLPSVNLSDEWQRWDSPFDVAFNFGPSVPFTAPPLRARDATTNTFVAAVGQPLLGLLHLSSDHAALTSSAEAASYDAHTLEANLRDETRAQFMRMFEARTLAGVAGSTKSMLGSCGSRPRATRRLARATSSAACA